MALTTSPALIKEGWIRAVVFFIAYLLVVVGAVYLESAVWTRLDPRATTSAIVESPLFYYVGVLMDAVIAIPLVLVFRRFIDRRSFVSLGLAWRGFDRQAWVGLLPGMVLLGVGSLVLFFTGSIWWTDTRWEAASFFSALGLMALTAFEEELVFRGYMLNNLLESLPRWTALGITSVIFMLMHLGNLHISPFAIVNLLAGGFLLGLNYMYTRNIWFSVFFHFSWNFFQGSILGYEVSGLPFQGLWPMEKNGPDWLTGGAFGFEGSVVATVLLVMAILLTARRKWWRGVS